MVENTVYLATEEVANRAGVLETAYMVSDGRFVIDSMDIRRIRLTCEEFLHGISGIEAVTEQEAELMISEAGYRRYGDETPGQAREEAPAEESLQQQPETPAADDGSSDGGSGDEGSSEDGSSDEGSSSSDTETNQEEE